jgi:hypothetical protein
MKLSGAWRGGKPGKKKTRPAYRPKIRWELLGLSNPDVDEPATSIETIRKEVSSLASRGFGQGTRSRSTTNQGAKSHEKSPHAASRRPKRRGATE